MDNSCKHSDRKKPVHKSIYCMIPFFKSTNKQKHWYQFPVKMGSWLERGIKKFLKVLIMLYFLTLEHVKGVSSICESGPDHTVKILAHFSMCIPRGLLYAQQWSESVRRDSGYSASLQPAQGEETNIYENIKNF